VLLCVNGSHTCAAPPPASKSFPPALTASGEIACAQFIEDQRENNTALMNLFVVWVWSFLIDHHGFVDVKLGHASDQVDLPDQATVLSFLERFCEHNPSSNVNNGTVALLKSRRRSGLEPTYAVIVGRMRVRKTMRGPIGRRNSRFKKAPLAVPIGGGSPPGHDGENPMQLFGTVQQSLEGSLKASQ
jgi:hypothetical protein